MKGYTDQFGCFRPEFNVDPQDSVTLTRGALSKETSKLVNLWIPETLLPAIDEAVVRNDTDRAKFIRTAIREKLLRGGIDPALFKPAA